MPNPPLSAQEPWQGVAAQIEAAIGESVPPPHAPAFDAFLERLKEEHPGYADMLEEARPLPPQGEENDEDEGGLVVTPKARLRRARQNASRKMWWRPAALSKNVVLNKKRGGPMLLAGVALIFGAYTLSYFAKPKASTGGLASGPNSYDSSAKSPGQTPQRLAAASNPAAVAASVSRGGPDASKNAASTPPPTKQLQPATPFEQAAPASPPLSQTPPISSPPPAFQPTSSPPVQVPLGAPLSSAAPVVLPSAPLPQRLPTFEGSPPVQLPLGAPGSSAAPVIPPSAPQSPRLPTSGQVASTAQSGAHDPVRAAGVVYKPKGQSQLPVSQPATPGVLYVRARGASTFSPASAPQSAGGIAAPAPSTLPATLPVVPELASTQNETPPQTQTFGRTEPFGGEGVDVPAVTGSGEAPSAAPFNTTPGLFYAAKPQGGSTATSNVMYSAQAKSSTGTSSAPSMETGIMASQNSQATTLATPAGLPSVGVVPARLITVLEAPIGRPVPAVAESEAGTWVGVAQANPESGRMDVTFTRLIQGAQTYQVNALAYDTSYQLGLGGVVNDRSPAFVQDLFRATLNSLNTYAQGVAQSGQTTVTNNTVTATKAATPLGTVLAGGLGQLFQLPQNNVSVLRTLRVERETAVYVMMGVGSSQGNP